MQAGVATRVLIVDDDARLRAFLAEELADAGYAAVEAGSGAAGLEAARQGGVDLVVLDWMLPDFSGVDLCRRLRASGVTLPVLMLSGRDAVSDRVQALDAGADDYLVKPFSSEELLARLRALQRRAAVEGDPPGAAAVLELADLRVIPASREVNRAGREIRLSSREYDLLLYLLQRAHTVVPRQEILREIWGDTFVGDANVLDVYIRYLRQKLEPAGLPTLVQTVRGVGFLLKPGPLKP